MVCFFGKSKAFLPSPMVSRNTWASNSRPFLGAGGGRVEFRVRCDFCSIGDGTAIFAETLDSRGEAMGAPPRSSHYTASCASGARMEPASSYDPQDLRSHRLIN